jgi:hypothetical protein
MTFAFRPAVRENVGLLIGLAGSSGSGKTYTALRLATGIAQGKPFAVIDTEAGRAKHYADAFNFDHGDLHAPFRPEAYAEAIAAADKAGYPVIVVDSMSHEWAGDGGILDWQEEEFQRLGGRDSAKMMSWIKPKMSHKHMVAKLLQVRAHLILCFRAEEKIDIIDDPDKPGKKKVVPKIGPGGFKGWLPICEKNLPYELTASFLLTADAPGVPKPIKLQEQHRALFPLDKPITEESGRAIAAWAAGGGAPPGPRELTPVEVLGGLRAAAALGSERLQAAWNKAGKEMRKALADELPKLKESAEAHDAARARKDASGPPIVTADSIIAQMDKRQDVDVLDADATLIDAIEDLVERERARNRYHELREQLGQL